MNVICVYVISKLSVYVYCHQMTSHNLLLIILKLCHPFTDKIALKIGPVKAA